jgi:hypothetical protein
VTVLKEKITSAIADAPALYHRLVLVVGPPRAGKTAALQAIAAECGWPLINLNLTLSERLLPLTQRQRPLRVASLVAKIVDETQSSVVLLDNLEMLFQPDLRQDPLRLLRSQSRNQTVVASWRGRADDKALTYATSDHPEYRRYEQPEALVVHAVARDTAIAG